MTLNCSHAFIHFKTCRRILKLEIPPPNTIIKLSFKSSEEMNGFIVEDWCQSCPRLTSKSTWDTLIVHFTIRKVYGDGYAVDFEFIPPSLPTLTFLTPPLSHHSPLFPNSFASMCIPFHTEHLMYLLSMRPMSERKHGDLSFWDDIIYLL